MLSRLFKTKLPFVFFLIAFTFLNILVFSFIYYANELRSTYISVINDAGKQRFYSQYMMQNAHMYLKTGDAELKMLLIATSNKMADAAERLHEEHYRDNENLQDVYTLTVEFLDATLAFTNEANEQNFLRMHRANEVMLPSVLEAVETMEDCFMLKQSRSAYSLFAIIVFIIISTLFLIRYIFMPTVSMLGASHEAQVILNKFYRVEDFNLGAETIFHTIKKGVPLHALFKGDEDRYAAFTSVLNEAQDGLEHTFYYNHKHYRVSVKNLNRFLMVVDIYDVTELIKENIRQETIYNSLKAIVVITDGKKIKNINRTFFEEFGFDDLEHFLSKYNCICELFMQKEGYAYLEAKMGTLGWNEYMQKHQDQLHEVLMIDKEGRERIYEVKSSGNFFRGQEEEVVVFNDITELKEKNNLLLLQSKDAAIGEMISMIAHQWRQPLSILSTILARIKIQKKMNMLDDASFYEAMEKSSLQIAYMSETIEDFREFFKDSNTMQNVTLKELVENPKNLVDALLESKEISFEVIYALEEHTRINTVMSKISQVFLNLYKNAIDQITNKEIEEGRIEVHVSMQGQKVIIEVCDNAGGIEEGVENRLFEPYFSTKSKNGTGLGLYMSKKIVEELLGGTIMAYNKERGACFCITLSQKQEVV